MDDQQHVGTASNLEAMAPMTEPTAAMRQYLAQTRPWVRLMSVLVFIGSGLMACGGVVLCVIVVAGSLLAPRGDMAAGVFGGVVVAVLYVGIGAVYVIPGVFLHRYAGAIARIDLGSPVTAVEDALRHQKSFWKFAGIASLIGLALSALGLALAVLIGALAGLAGLAAR